MLGVGNGADAGRGRLRVWRAAVVVLVAAIAALVAFGLFLPISANPMDEPEYLILAEGYRNGLLHRMPHEPGAPVNFPAGPLLPLALAGFQIVAGDDLVTAKYAIACLYPILMVLLAVLFLRRFHPLWAGLAVLGIALTYSIGEFSWQVMTEIPFALLATVWLLASDTWERSAGRKRGWLVLVLISLGYLLRPAGVVLGLSSAVWAALRRRWRVASLAVAIAIVLPLGWNLLLDREAARVGKRFGPTHLAYAVRRAGRGTDHSLRAVLTGLIVSRPEQVNTMVTLDLPKMLRFSGQYETWFGGALQGKLTALTSILFLLSALAGSFLLVKHRRSEGVLGILVPLYLAEVILFHSAVRFLVPIFPFMVFAALYAWAQLGALIQRSHSRRLTVWATAIAVLAATQVVALNGWDIYEQAARRAAWRNGVAEAAPYKHFVAHYLAAEWIARPSR
jgi:4-amino-4-deoxy-L-arabinose transferase-like glycosyltransferase